MEAVAADAPHFGLVAGWGSHIDWTEEPVDRTDHKASAVGLRALTGYRSVHNAQTGCRADCLANLDFALLAGRVGLIVPGEKVAAVATELADQGHSWESGSSPGVALLLEEPLVEEQEVAKPWVEPANAEEVGFSFLPLLCLRPHLDCPHPGRH